VLFDVEVEELGDLTRNMKRWLWSLEIICQTDFLEGAGGDTS